MISIPASVVWTIIGSVLTTLFAVWLRDKLTDKREKVDKLTTWKENVHADMGKLADEMRECFVSEKFLTVYLVPIRQDLSKLAQLLEKFDEKNNDAHEKIHVRIRNLTNQNDMIHGKLFEKINDVKQNCKNET